ncbi:tetratricopeptide repeat protein [Denitrobaculum tricleocarpae]|uniref:Tetratricopeptide repeat protein n=1 Tax=Denitrobaculum tricleocarpae TaxID=2591009 RepID=A0A545TPS8_9PROT|nr:tetratricopeptide repeat protein [Denitrobaculum tricleocarpae]TQV79230.1 tetratricopeptide repeat protein [Denitrobaculum tricleocarpae]
MMGSEFPIKTAAKTILTGTALLFLGACASVPVTSDREQQVGSAQILSICEKLAKSNDTRIAIGLCEKAHIDDPDNPLPLLILGDMLQQQGALAQAGRAYGMAIDLDPENVEAHYGLGKVFLARNQYELATEQFEVARELNARDHRLYNALGVVLDNLGDHVAAQEHYRIGLELAPNNRALMKNLTLSRRLDNSVTTPAIGPQFEVVPSPASTPGNTPNGGGGPAVAPRSTPQQRQDPGAPAGRLGHEPLAYAPNTPPQKDPYLPETKSVAAQTSTRQFAVTARHSPSEAGLTGADVIGPNEFPVTIQARRTPPSVAQTRSIPQVATTAEREQEKRLLIAQSEAIDPLPAGEVRPAGTGKSPTAGSEASGSEPTGLKTEKSSLAYFPIVAPAHNQPGTIAQNSSAQNSSAQIDVQPVIEASPENSREGLAVLHPALNSIRVTAAPLPAPKAPVTDAAVAAGPKILAAGLKAEIVASEPLAAATVAPQPLQMAALPQDPIGAQSLQPKERIRAIPAKTLVPTSLAEVLTAETSASALTLDLDPAADAAVKSAAKSGAELAANPAANPAVVVESPSAPKSKLALGANRFGVERPEKAVAAARPSDAAKVKSLPRVPRHRFGREHEDDHETRHVEGEFWDLVDVVNPMQHIPVVASIYRDVTEDEIKPAAKIAGGTLFGGVLGFASSIFDSVVEEASGQDMTQTAVSALSQDQDDDARHVAALRREKAETERLLQESRR